MAILPVQLARVSNLLRSGVAQQQIASTEQQLLDTQNQLTTGKRINTPSDDPGDAAIVIQLQKTLDQHQSYLSNIQQAQSQLSAVDSTLGDVGNLLQQAQNLASANVGSDVTADQRKSASALVQSLYTQAVGLGNTQFEGTYVFAGTKGTDPPFVDAGGGVKFVGSTSLLQNAYAQNTDLSFMVSGADVFGALSSQVQGGATGLAPALAADTRLSDLAGAGGSGVRPGAILLSDGTTSKTVDLSSADTVGNVIDAIDAANVGGITASLSPPDGIQLSGGASANITVKDVGGGTVAADLGIARSTGAGAGAPLAGSDVQPRITPLTPLSALRGGAGIDKAAGLKITNGPNSAVVNLSSAHTVEDLLNAINGAGVNVQASINASGAGIDVLNPVQGTQMTIAENGGTTAADLGIRSFSPSTSLAQLNNGAGVRTAAGADFKVTSSSGVSFSVDVDGAATVQDVIDRINAAGTAAGAGVAASFASSGGNGIKLTDTAGGAGTLSVSALNASSAAADLGLTAPASGNVINGSDVNAVQTSGVFADLAKLRDALSANDQAGITSAAGALKDDFGRVTDVRGQTGARVQDFQQRQSQLEDEDLTTKSLISSLSDTDITSAVSKFQTLQTALQAALQTTGKVLNLSLLDFLA